MGSSVSLSNLPGWALIAIAVMAVIEVALLVTALVVLVRTPPSRLTLPMWVWIVIIVIVSTLGPIAFLVAGRRPPEAEPGAMRRADSGAGSSAADLLYGAPSDRDARDAR